MLSKLKAFRREKDSTVYLSDGSELVTELQAKLGTDLDNLRTIKGGTLGICLQGQLKGCPRFFKTHSVPSGRSTLEREALLLDRTSGERIDVQVLDIGEGNSRRTWLHTKLLQPSDALAPEAVRSLIAKYGLLLKEGAHVREVQHSESIQLLLSEADSAVVSLTDLGLLSASIQSRVVECIVRMRALCDCAPPQLCHGDLGPNNIMADDETIIAVDWEDIFWGIAGYDYLYWLTFFKNRKWLLQEQLGFTPWGISNEIAVMVVILLLKSNLSVLTGSYRDNSISIGQRLMEVISLA